MQNSDSPNSSKPANDDFDADFDAQEAREEAEKRARSAEFEALLNENLKQGRKKLAVGDKLKCEILVVGKEEIFVSTGTMNDGAVQRRELLTPEGEFPYKVGDKIDLYVTLVKGTDVRLSPNPTAKNLADDLEDAFDMMLPVEGRVVEVCKGGWRVSVHGKLAFCPVSQMDTRRIEDGQFEEYVGKKFPFRITQFSEGGRNIVVSRRKILDEEQELAAGSFAQDRKIGDILTGRVARLEKFGAFIEIAPGVDGLAHISELSWERVNDPSEVVKVGQEVKAKILKMDSNEGKLRISLSIKQAGGEPWEGLPDRIRTGQVVEGKVTKCMKFGCFVQLVPGVEGLVPLSEMSYTKRVVRSDELMQEGETVSVMIKEINSDTKKILLSLKDAGSDPWALVAQKFPVGTIVTGRIERREPYGLFIKLEEGITGLLPKSKANDNPEFPFDKLKVGENATIQVAEIRREERRISLQVPKDPESEEWRNYSKPEASSSGSLGTLGGAWGDKLKAALDKKKK